MLISHNEGKGFARLVSLMRILQHRSRNAVKADSMVLIQGVARRGRWDITCRDEQELGTASPASRGFPAATQHATPTTDGFLLHPKYL